MNPCTTKTCSQCGIEKSLEEFTKAKASKNFKSANSKQTHHTYCKSCNASRAREWRKTHTNYKGSGRITDIPAEDRLLMSAIRQRITDAKSRCKKFGKSPPEIADIQMYELYKLQDRKCALTGADFVLETNHQLSPSLDQIDPGKGYVLGNVQWLAWCVNRAKGDLSLSDFYEMCSVVLDRKEQRLSNGSES